MGKTRQRIASAYGEGRRDGRTGKSFQWASHPYLSVYRRGYIEGRNDAKAPGR